MEVALVHYTPLIVCSRAIRTCWNSFDKSDGGGPVDFKLIERVGTKLKHESTLEHIVFSFEIRGISRACLQELARHRMASLSVKSTRYTLKELKKEPPLSFSPQDMQRASQYVVLIEGDDIYAQSVNEAIIAALEKLRQLLVDGVPNDEAKYALPEAYKTALSWTINLRSLRNFIALRTSANALWEIQKLADKILDALPTDYYKLALPTSGDD